MPEGSAAASPTPAFSPSASRTAELRVYRGDSEGGALKAYEVETYPGMVVLDAIHDIQARQEPSLAVRWNCKAGRCGSCSAEINGKPRLMCMTRMSHYEAGQPITVTPMRSFPVIKDLVTDVSFNYEMAKKIPPFKPRPRDADGTWRMQQKDIDRIQEFRKCIECFLCQDVCHVVRDHKKTNFAGPRFLIQLAGLDMHPLDTLDRHELVKDEFKLGLCNITKCCSEVCPENIHITDNAIIPLKERVADDHYDPVKWVLRKLGGGPRKEKARLPMLTTSDPLPDAGKAPGSRPGPGE
ncbi:MAG: succinate dehydrogenase/fumarate reductase iron-sulfur subunit [Myxococcota bacterium]|nr:succinate dehydrogenase/fumarate reductase iron-sulfur subunit [Myxococcota bacterium]